MKKSLIALAVLAASGAAMAQSSVTISGNVNMGVVKQDTLNTTTNPGAKVSNSAKLDAANGATQIAFRGVEDLGGGLKANFTLVQRLSPESGGNDGSKNGRPTFQGESTVGLSGNFGAIKLGRSLTAFQGPINATDPWGTWTVGSTAILASGTNPRPLVALANLPTVNAGAIGDRRTYSTDPVHSQLQDGAGAARTDAITYASPVFAGFSAAVSLGLKNSTATPGAAAADKPTNPKNLASFWVSYANGPVMIGGGGEQNRFDDKVSAILGTYDFGIVKLGAGYSQVDLSNIVGEKGKNWNLMATAPFGAFTLKAGYYNSKAEGNELKTTKYGIGGEYALSKRTYLYTTFGRAKTDGTEAVKGFDIGLNHAF